MSQAIETGSKQAFLKLKEVYPQVCLVHLYTLEREQFKKINFQMNLIGW